MPANLTPEYHDAEERFKSAESTEEKVRFLEEMLRVIPKHKGTEKMQADLKRRLSKLRKASSKEQASGAQRRPFHFVEREGAGRVVVAGPPNSGKSSFLARLTHAEVEVADYPYTTRIPLPGMMPYEDIQIQLVDTPPFAPEVLEPWMLAMIEQSDITLLVFDVNDPNLLDQTDFVLGKLEERGLELSSSQKPKVIVLGNKCDQEGGRENFDAWRELFEGRIEPIDFSILSESDLLHLKSLLFKHLDIVRVYTKAPGEKVEEDPTPFVLRSGSTVLEAARAVHKDLAESFKFARIWSHDQDKYDGQMVERDHVLHDGDLLEVHT